MTMSKREQRKQERIEQLFAECQFKVIAQIIGPFGLSPAMIKDRDGGNVTTLENFKREDSTYVADKDLASHRQSKADFERGAWTPDDWNKRSESVRASGKDNYTGKVHEPGDLDADHVRSLKTFAGDAKTHLAFETGKGVDRAREVVNDSKNLAATHASINRSKGSQSLDEFAGGRGQKYELDPEAVSEAKEQSDRHIDSAQSTALREKQAAELLETGGQQAMANGLRAAIGVLLTDLAQSVFHEIKLLLRHGLDASKSLLEELRLRLEKMLGSLAAKVPEALGQLLEGGVGGFLSNLLTFVINSFLSTATRVVTAIREGLLGILNAARTMLFPPEGMTQEQAVRAGLKILAAVVATSAGVLMQEAAIAFLATVPVLGQFAEIVTPVLLGILSGIASAFLAYQIDAWFDRHLNNTGEELLDELERDAQRREEFAGELVSLSEVSLRNVHAYTQAKRIYEQAIRTVAEAARQTTRASNALGNTLAMADASATRTEAAVEHFTKLSSAIDVRIMRLAK